METQQATPNRGRISRKEVLQAVRMPLAFVIFLWVLDWYFLKDHGRWLDYGIMPRSMEGLIGIAMAPLLHADIDHLLSNTTPLLVIGTGLFHFYREIAWKVCLMIWTFSGSWVWLIGRQEYHIGASGLVYGGVVFLFFSGIFRKDVRLMAISLLVVFLYGSLAWGILPIDPTQSWESHLSGSIAGLFASVYYRNNGPKRRLYQWEIDEKLEAEAAQETIDSTQSELPGNGTDSNTIDVRYEYKEKRDPD